MKADLPEGVSQVKLWDPALRLFHWALVLCVGVGWGLGKFGPNIMTLHFYAGYAVIGLLVFRFVWGLFGPRPARFSHFVPGPRALTGYLSGIGSRKPSYWPGHNPVGALSVIAMLLALSVQVATGLFADPDDYVNVGPLADMVSSEANRTATRIHSQMAWGILALVGLHLAAILFYRIYKREDLVRPMITGWKLVKHRQD